MSRAEDALWLNATVPQGLVSMAQTELAPGTNPATRQLAQQIITSQQAEIGENAAAATAKLIDTVVAWAVGTSCRGTR